MSKIVKPELSGGTRDMLPEEAAVFFNFVDKIISVYKKFGFVPLDTPCMERLSVLTGGSDDFDKTIFKTRIVKGKEDSQEKENELGEESGLRFDLTVPLARAVSAYPEISRPFKRYQLGKVFRGERQQSGRYREFYQLDFDIIGSSSRAADLEAVQVIYRSLQAIGLDNFLIKINSRKILAGLAEIISCADQTDELLRIIDKTDKIGLEAVLDQLRKDKELNLDKEKVEEIEKFFSLNKSDKLEKDLPEFFSGRSEIGKEGAEEVLYIIKGLKSLGLSEEKFVFDPSVARGLAYYNGPVFEAVLSDLPELGSVFAGGRYDGLTNRFVKGSNISGVGASIGLDRILSGLERLGKLEKNDFDSLVLVSVFNEELRNDSNLFAQKLREAGVEAEVYLGEDSSVGGQISYALKKRARYFVIIGPEEKENSMIQLKDLKKREQKKLDEETCLKEILGEFTS